MRNVFVILDYMFNPYFAPSRLEYNFQRARYQAILDIHPTNRFTSMRKRELDYVFSQDH